MPDKHCRYLGSRAENSAFDRSFWRIESGTGRRTEWRDYCRRRVRDGVIDSELSILGKPFMGGGIQFRFAWHDRQRPFKRGGPDDMPDTTLAHNKVRENWSM